MNLSPLILFSHINSIGKYMNHMLIYTCSQQRSQLYFFSFNQIPETVLGVSGQGATSLHISSPDFAVSGVLDGLQTQCKKTSQERKRENIGRRGKKHVSKLEPNNDPGS